MEKDCRNEGVVVDDVAAEARESELLEVGRLGIAKRAVRVSVKDLLLGLGGSFVYFLFDGSRCVYVGKTKYFAGRMRAHAAEKKFTAIYALAVPQRMLSAVERHWITTLNPRDNRQLTGFVIRDGWPDLVEANELATIAGAARMLGVPQATLSSACAAGKIRTNNLACGMPILILADVKAWAKTWTPGVRGRKPTADPTRAAKRGRE